MYYDGEIDGLKKYWTVWLSGFTVGETKPADIEDRNRIAVSISANFHRTDKARFKTKVDKADPSIFWVTRVE